MKNDRIIKDVKGMMWKKQNTVYFKVLSWRNRGNHKKTFKLGTSWI